MRSTRSTQARGRGRAVSGSSRPGGEAFELGAKQLGPKRSDERQLAAPCRDPLEIDVDEQHRLLEPRSLGDDLAERIDDVRAAPEREVALCPDAVDEDDVALEHSRVE